MLDRETMRKTYHSFFKLEGEELENKLDEYEYRYRHYKGGDRVIQVRYFGGALPEEEFIRIEQSLKPHNIALSFVDITFEPQASLIHHITEIWIAYDLTNEIIKSAVWDIFKAGLNQIFRTAKKQVVKRIDSAGNVTVPPTDTRITFDLNINRGRQVSFSLPKDTDAKLAAVAIESIPKIVDAVANVPMANDDERIHLDLRLSDKKRNWVDGEALDESPKAKTKREKHKKKNQDKKREKKRKK